MMNTKLMQKLGLTDADLIKTDELEDVKSEQEMIGSTLEYILTEVLPMLMGEGDEYDS